jgi:glycosyltransferase involved in cell wall biosynthesis
MVMLEAMALGVAVVARKVGGIPEVIRHGVNGLLVSSDSPKELANACMSLYDSPDLRKNLTEGACDDIHRRYSAEKHARTIVELYQSLCCWQMQ